MSSLQQTPKKGQAVPPAALIDGVSEQQIDAAVKAHVRKTVKSAPIAAGAHGAFTFGQLAGQAFNVVHDLTKVQSLMVVLDGSGYESFADLEEDQQRAVINLVASTLFEVNEKATKLMHILELAEVRA